MQSADYQNGNDTEVEGWNYKPQNIFFLEIRSEKHQRLLNRCISFKKDHATKQSDNETTSFIWYCLPDSRPTMFYESRDFVPGYSRFARYCLPDRGD